MDKMEWVLRSSQIHSIFSNLGYVQADGYHVNENCNAALEAILLNILTEDKYLRTYRRSISFGENIKRDLIPLLIHAKEDKTIELLTRILVNLTIPTECLLSIDIISQNDFGRHTIFEINNLLASTKDAFTDHRATRAVIDFLRKNVDVELKTKLLPEQCSNVSNSLLLLRNILHIPENSIQTTGHSGAPHTVQNQILWNIFSQSIDKILIKLMSIPDACYWGITMVQLIALLYKDQHVVTLHKLINMWLESTLSESSEDNESNTPPDRGNSGSEDSSLMLTSDPTSDLSDTGKSNDAPNMANNEWQASTNDKANESTGQNANENEKTTQAQEENQTNVEVKIGSEENNINDNIDDPMKFDNDTAASCTSGIQSEQSDPSQNKSEKKVGKSETSDCGYGTQIENQESISTSSNEDDRPSKKPVHQKPHNLKQKANTKVRSGSTLQERKRKKIVKRGKSNIINVQGLTHITPTDEDIANVLKEFAVDFLLKGYNSLVQMLHNEILSKQQLEMDTSHFFWLVSYFLKFATQIELDLEHVSSVLSYEIVSYLTAEGVSLCEQFELTIKLDGHTLAPTSRRLHLIVTAIREFVQALDEYKKLTTLSKEDHEALIKLQIKMCDTDELRLLLLLLIRHYNPTYQSKQYLQDLIETNHILLMFLDNVMKMPEYNGSANMVDHLRQFATPEVMHQYGILFEDYWSNGEFVNDCIFTVMHHVAGDLDSIASLHQARILQTFTSLWRSDYEICDDWNDLVEYVINTFVKKPHPETLMFAKFRMDIEKQNNDSNKSRKLAVMAGAQCQEDNHTEGKRKSAKRNAGVSSAERWTEDEISSLNWAYMQSNSSPTVIEKIMKILKDDGIVKPKESIIKELYTQNIITEKEFKKMMKSENNKTEHSSKDWRDDDIFKLCTQIADDGKSKLLDWVQKVLLDTCYAKIYLAKRKQDESVVDDSKLLNFEVFKKKANEMPVISPVSYHSLLLEQSIPLVPWNCQQASVCKDLKFLQLLHRLGFHMPVDSGKVFIRIPHFWTADFLYAVAGKISPIDTTKLKFSVNEFAETSAAKPGQEGLISSDANKYDHAMELDNYYQVHKQTHFATMVNFTPMPGCYYNSEASETDSKNWLKVVQKSQEFKLTLNTDSGNSGEEQPSGDAAMCGEPEEAAPAVAVADYAMFMRSTELLPTVMTVKQEISTFSFHHVDNDFYNSACETASVASDLTRMYVSDEDEKSQEPICLRAPLDIPSPWFSELCGAPSPPSSALCGTRSPLTSVPGGALSPASSVLCGAPSPQSCGSGGALSPVSSVLMGASSSLTSVPGGALSPVSSVLCGAPSPESSVPGDALSPLSNGPGCASPLSSMVVGAPSPLSSISDCALSPLLCMHDSAPSLTSCMLMGAPSSLSSVPGGAPSPQLSEFMGIRSPLSSVAGGALSPLLSVPGGFPSPQPSVPGGASSPLSSLLVGVPSPLADDDSHYSAQPRKRPRVTFASPF